MEFTDFMWWKLGLFALACFMYGLWQGINRK